MKTGTCIIAYKDIKGQIYFGCDSAATDSNSLEIRRDKKIFRKGDCYIGFSGSFRIGQVLKYSVNFPARKVYRDEDIRYIFQFVENCHETFRNYDFLRNDEDGCPVFPGEFIVVHNGNFYVVYNDFQIAQLEQNFAAIGCGADYAIGALHSLEARPQLTGHQKVMEALQIAEKCCPGVRQPFHIERIGKTEFEEGGFTEGGFTEGGLVPTKDELFTSDVVKIV